MASKNEWDGFKPTGYEINWKRLSDAPLTEIRDDKSRVQITAQTVLQEALPHLFAPLNPDGSVGAAPERHQCDVNVDVPGRLKIQTLDRTILLDTLGNETGFAADVLATLIKIDQTAGSQTFHPLFFYYDRDHVMDDPHDSFSFFVVNDDCIVLDRVSFSRFRGNGFDPKLFRPFDRGRKIWQSDSFVEEAELRGWYRKFYEETAAGRLTTFRDDVTLYHYVPEWKQRQLVAETVLQIAENSARLQKLVIYVLIALGLILLSLWR